MCAFEQEEDRVKIMPLGRLIKTVSLPPGEDTARFECGAVTFGVEFRNPTSYQDPEKAAIALKVWEVPDGTVFDDQGVAIHVWDTATGDEPLRFDCLGSEPHYHYDFPAEKQHYVVPYDKFANGPDMLGWTLSCLRTRLPAMLSNTGCPELAEKVDLESVGRVLDEVEREARRVERSTGSEQRPADHARSSAP